MAARNTPSAGGKPDKLWRDALMMASKRSEDETAEIIADKKAPMMARAAAQCFVKAVAGDVPAMKEIGDRIDGKPAQQVTLDGAVGSYAALPIPVEQRHPLARTNGAATNGHSAPRN